MQRRSNKHHLHYLLIVFAISLFALPRVSQAQGQPAMSSADLDAAKAALAKYSHPLAAVKDGFFSTGQHMTTIGVRALWIAAAILRIRAGLPLRS